MPSYPAFALLLGSAMAAGGKWIRGGTVSLSIVVGVCALACFAILFTVRNYPAPGDISGALSSHPGAYTLSLGHMADLTLESFAYLRLPLAMAGVAFLLGVLGTIRASSQRAFLAAALMMVLFFHAARLAMVVFDPYMSSRPLAEAYRRAPAGELIVDHHYYDFSSVFFYTNHRALLLNGRFHNLVYGSYAPGAPPVFIHNGQFQELWKRRERYYLVAEKAGLGRAENLVGKAALSLVAQSGGKFLLTNHPATGTLPLP